MRIPLGRGEESGEIDECRGGGNSYYKSHANRWNLPRCFSPHFVIQTVTLEVCMYSVKNLGSTLLPCTVPYCPTRQLSSSAYTIDLTVALH